MNRLHPSIREAMRIRAGVSSMPDSEDRVEAMIELVDDQDGEIAKGLVMILVAERNPMNALIIAFLAGMLHERDR